MRLGKSDLVYTLFGYTRQINVWCLNFQLSAGCKLNDRRLLRLHVYINKGQCLWPPNKELLSAASFVFLFRRTQSLLSIASSSDLAKPKGSPITDHPSELQKSYRSQRHTIQMQRSLYMNSTTCTYARSGRSLGKLERFKVRSLQVGGVVKEENEWKCMATKAKYVLTCV